MMWGQWGMGWGFGGFFMLLWWLLVIVGVVALVRWLMPWGPRAGGERGAESPLDILKERYARGEIGREEFERMKRELKEP